MQFGGRRPAFFLPHPLTERSSIPKETAMSMNATQSIDTRGMNCPLPILKTKKALADLAAGQTLAVTATDPGSLKDMQAFCKQTGNELIASNANQGEFEFLIRKA
jgi:tRNA 2-thiouridine synthesizing protein A